MFTIVPVGFYHQSIALPIDELAGILAEHSQSGFGPVGLQRDRVGFVRKHFLHPARQTFLLDIGKGRMDGLDREGVHRLINNHRIALGWLLWAYPIVALGDVQGPRPAEIRFVLSTSADGQRKYT